MNTSLVMTIIGEDKPGLVEWLSTLVADHEANWLESRMARLSGQFAGILHVEVPQEHEAALTQALKQLDARGIQVTVTESRPIQALPDRLIHLDLVGQDRPGIVRQISRAIAALGVNVEELHTTCESAPMSGEMLFKAKARLRVPAAVSLAQLQEELEHVGQDLLVDVVLDLAHGA